MKRLLAQSRALGFLLSLKNGQEPCPLPGRRGWGFASDLGRSPRTGRRAQGEPYPGDRPSKPDSLPAAPDPLPAARLSLTNVSCVVMWTRFRPCVNGGGGKWRGA